MKKPLPPLFYRRATKQVARELLGKQLFHKRDGQLTSGIIIETEAYIGETDKACHSYGGRRTPRTEIMYQDGGYTYVYLIYGMHYCLNTVTRTVGEPEAVLIRALKPVDGIDIMQRRRKLKSPKNLNALCSGPGKLCQALAIDHSTNGLSLQSSEIWITEGLPYEKIKRKIIAGPRVGIDYAEDAIGWPLRFKIDI